MSTVPCVVHRLVDVVAPTVHFPPTPARTGVPAGRAHTAGAPILSRKWPYLQNTKQPRRGSWTQPEPYPSPRPAPDPWLGDPPSQGANTPQHLRALYNITADGTVPGNRFCSAGQQD